ncbi:MAG: hypothetical protein COA50_06130 [Flavobacteriaceae bacterium]|nr:MAG: hypothetical protein COA50_06130 [Flavobacteriaceae bacterium]
MQTKTLLLILLSVIVALGITWFQYYYKTKKRGKLSVILSFLRFLSIFGALLLLINPKFSKNDYTLEKTNLILLLDNSSSINTTTGKEDIQAIVHQIEGNAVLSDKFKIAQYTFGSSLNSSDSLTLDEKRTNISEAIESINEIYNKTNTAIVLLTDGNQTIGKDYEFYGRTQKRAIFPIVLGDTTTYEDLRIGQVNSNKYAFLKNKYPVEVYITYDGTKSIATRVTIQVNGTSLFTEQIRLSPTAPTKRIQALLDAKTVGLKKINISVVPLTNEKNTLNNSKNIAVEVVDEKTKIVIVSDMVHPDIGALKKTIESNEQRTVIIKKPTDTFSDYNDIGLFILYQPNSTFKRILTFIDQKGANTLTITGPKTDWNFLNNSQSSIEKNSTGVAEDVFPILNSGFSLFNISDFDMQGFPPLKAELGELFITKVYQTMLGQQIKGVQMNEPLLAIVPGNAKREAYLFGENIWKWRAQTYRSNRNFKNFDDLIGKIVLYLSSTKAIERLTLDYETIYTGIQGAKITASYFDETFVFDQNATLLLKLTIKDDGSTFDIPMLLIGNHYEADLSSLESGVYDFRVSVEGENISKAGIFTILNFDVEQQYLSSNYRKLDRLAQNTNGKLYFASQTSELVADFIGDKQYIPVQKSKQNVVSLIDFKFLLGIIIAALAAEWFIRKYNGLI